MKRSEKILLTAINLSYFLLFIILLPFYRHQINPDSISLINIANKYLSGEFMLAVNGYWPPLISWLLSFFMLVFKNPIIAFKALSFFVGLFALFSFNRLLSALKTSFTAKTLSLAASVAGVLYFSLTVASSDLLAASLMLYYLSLIIEENSFKNRFFFLKVGIVGVLLYFSKTYGFYFFIFHFLFAALMEALSGKEKVRTVRVSVFALLVFSLLSAAWIAPISIKYGVFTIGTTGKFNYASFGPDAAAVRRPYIHAMAIPDSMSTSNWDDPSNVYEEAWSPFSSKENILHQAKLLKKNIPWMIDLYNSFSYLSLLIIAASLLLLFMGRRREQILILLSASLLSSAGYLMIAFEQRYLWVNFFILILLSVIILDELKMKERAKTVALALILLTFLIMPLRNLYSDLNVNKDIYDSYMSLDKKDVKGNTASDSNRAFMTILSFYLKNHYYGAFGKEIDQETFQKELNDNKIEYYYLFDRKDTALIDVLKENWEIHHESERFTVLKRTDAKKE
ncbi:MAG: hypothetical protein AB7T10_02280 [bacterium]